MTSKIYKIFCNVCHHESIHSEEICPECDSRNISAVEIDDESSMEDDLNNSYYDDKTGADIVVDENDLNNAF